MDQFGEIELLKRKLQDLEEELVNKDKSMELCDSKLRKLEGQLLARDATIKQLSNEDKHAVEKCQIQCDNAARETDAVRKELGNYVARYVESRKAREAKENEALGYKAFYEQASNMLKAQKTKFDASKMGYESQIRKLQMHIDCLLIVLSHRGASETPSIANPEGIEREATLQVPSVPMGHSSCASSSGNGSKIASKFDMLQERRSAAKSVLSPACSSSKFLSKLDSVEESDQEPCDNVSMRSDAAATDTYLNLTPKVQIRLKELHKLMDVCKADAAKVKPPKKSRSDFRKFFGALFGKKAVVECETSEVDAGQSKTTELNGADSVDNAENPSSIQRKRATLSANIARIFSRIRH